MTDDKSARTAGGLLQPRKGLPTVSGRLSAGQSVSGRLFAGQSVSASGGLLAGCTSWQSGRPLTWPSSVPVHAEQTGSGVSVHTPGRTAHTLCCLPRASRARYCSLLTVGCLSVFFCFRDPPPPHPLLYLCLPAVKYCVSLSPRGGILRTRRLWPLY